MGSGWAQADTVRLKDGSILFGQITKMVDGKISITTSFAGELAIPATEVTGIESMESKPVHLKDGTVIQGTIRSTGTTQMEVIRTEDQTIVPIQAEEITAIAPPAPAGPPPVKWKGEIVGSMAITDGNSETTAIGISGDLNRRTEEDRINLRAGYYYSETHSDSIRDDQFASGKYDYFFNEKLFGYLNTRIDRDAIKDLENRTTGGLGLGYQFIEDDTWKIFGEGGLSYVNENYGNSADDSSYVAGRAAVSFEWWIVKEKLRFTETSELLLSLDDTDDWISINEAALTWKWNERWSSNAGIRYEFDNTPARGQEEGDTKYTLGVGYSF
ncbi:MAG: DUF481 domain-containing protein [bacterium]|nr:DUF481 domain-containing protein [bacterium]